MSSLPAAPPTRTRYWVVVFAIILAMVQYIDRICIAQAESAITADLGLSNKQWGMVLSAFGLAYALFEIPTGWLGDKIGARRVLVGVVLWWSFFTAATGWMWNHVSLVVTRFLFGAGEAGCFPNLTKAFSAWLPKDERTRAQAIMWMGARWGGAMAPLLVVAVMTQVSWRWAFQIFALLGVVWTVFFWRWFRDNPRNHKSVNAAELALLKDNAQNVEGHGDVPWGRLFRSPNMWLLWGQYFCLSYGWYFYVTWLPKYLRTERTMNFRDNAVLRWLAETLQRSSDGAHGWLSPETTDKVIAAALAGIPLFFGGIGSLVAGMMASRLIARTGRVVAVRRTFGFVGLAGASGLLMSAYYINDPLMAMMAMGLASFSNDLAMPGSWASCMDIGGKYAGTVSGSMNMMGNFGGMAAPSVIGWILDLNKAHPNWQLVFAVSAVIYFLGAVIWLFIDPVTPLEKRGEPASA
jgi:ACS family glucarate transporter-like MFS transporter